MVGNHRNVLQSRRSRLLTGAGLAVIVTAGEAMNDFRCPDDVERPAGGFDRHIIYLFITVAKIVLSSMASDVTGSLGHHDANWWW